MKVFRRIVTGTTIADDALLVKGLIGLAFALGLVVGAFVVILITG